MKRLNDYRKRKDREMKKLIILALGLGALSCTNSKLINYNTDRLDTIEDYLKENKPYPGSKEYKSLEKEAESWSNQQQQEQPNQQ